MADGHNDIKRWLLPKLEKAGLSVEKLANLVGVNRAAIYFYLTDACRPTEQTMIRICQVLGVPPEEGLSQYSPKRGGKLVARPRGGKPKDSAYNSHLYD